MSTTTKDTLYDQACCLQLHERRDVRAASSVKVTLTCSSQACLVKTPDDKQVSALDKFAYEPVAENIPKVSLVTQAIVGIIRLL